MRLITKTYGIMPIREEFDWLWEAVDANEGFRDGKFHFGNDPRLGTCALTQNELWDELQKAYDEFDDGTSSDNFETSKAEQTGDWLSSVLGCLGLEWI